MKDIRQLFTARLFAMTLLAFLAASPAMAHHVVWLDFSEFTLDAWNTINGNSPTASDVTAVSELVLANMVEDYAPFDIHFTTAEPPRGRHTRVKFMEISITMPDGSTLNGCAGPACCADGGCTGFSTWDEMTVSGAEVYAGTFTQSTQFTGTNATTARVANTISHTASHELGHVLGLAHCHAADDSFEVGCSEDRTPTRTADTNPNFHIMASGGSWGLTATQRATRDRFFSIHSSRRILYGALQARNHWNPLANVDAGSGSSDLVYGRVMDPSTIKWWGRKSNGSQFGNASIWNVDAGKAGDIYLTGDVDGDDRADLVYGRILSSNTVRWWIRLSDSNTFGDYTRWSLDAGDPGDIFRLADVDGDGLSDLVYGRPISKNQIRWFVRKSDGSSFGNFSIFHDDAGKEGDLFFLGDVDNDGDADLVYGRKKSFSQFKWFVRLSNGTEFGSARTWRSDAGNPDDLFYLADGNGDGDADLIYGRMKSRTEVRWYLRQSTGSKFGSREKWHDDAGAAGDLFRLGDGDGDGRFDLLYGRNRLMDDLDTTPNLTNIRWFGRLSLGDEFGNWTTWRSDAGDEGDFFP